MKTILLLCLLLAVPTGTASSQPAQPDTVPATCAEVGNLQEMGFYAITCTPSPDGLTPPAGCWYDLYRYPSPDGDRRADRWQWELTCQADNDDPATVAPILHM